MSNRLSHLYCTNGLALTDITTVGREASELLLSSSEEIPDRNGKDTTGERLDTTRTSSLLNPRNGGCVCILRPAILRDTEEADVRSLGPIPSAYMQQLIRPAERPALNESTPVAVSGASSPTLHFQICCLLHTQPASYSAPRAMYSKGIWSTDEHERFLQALRANPQASWLEMSEQVVTRSPRQVQSHAQKYNAKIDRHARGLRKVRRHLTRKEHRIERETNSTDADHPLASTKEPYEPHIERPISSEVDLDISPVVSTKRMTMLSLPTVPQSMMMELLSFGEQAVQWNESDVYEDYFEYLLPLLANEGASPSSMDMQVYMTYV